MLLSALIEELERIGEAHGNLQVYRASPEAVPVHVVAVETGSHPQTEIVVIR